MSLICADERNEEQLDKITFQYVSKAFGNVKALNGLDLQISEGEAYTLLGHNGADKTTTLRLLLGLLEPGGIAVFGKNPIKEGNRVRGFCGVLSEDVELYEPLFVFDNLKPCTIQDCTGLLTFSVYYLLTSSRKGGFSFAPKSCRISSSKQYERRCRN